MSRAMSITTRSPSSHPPFVRSDDLRNNPALSAALASQKPSVPTPPPKKLTKNGFVSSGALAAAARAGTGQRPATSTGAGLVNDGATRRPSVERPLVPPRNGSTTSLSPSVAGSGYQDPGLSTAPSFRQASPSHIAAVRAAARSTTPGASSVSKIQGVRKSPPRHDPSPERKDERPIPPTNRLVQLFEERSKHGDDAVKPVTATGPSVVLSPRPTRTASIKSIVGESERAPSQPTKAPAPLPPRPVSRARDNTTANAGLNLTVDDAPPRHTLSRTASRPTLHSRQGSQASMASVSRTSMYGLPVQPRKPKPRSISLDRDMASKHSTPHATPLGSPGPGPRPTLRPSPSERSLTTQMAVPSGGRREMSRPRSSFNPSKVQPQLNVNALANAMVASSLASSRAPSPHKPPPPDPFKFPPPPPPSRRHGKTAAMSFLVPHQSGPPKMSGQSTSPPKTTLKQTLRKQPTGPQDEKRGRPAIHDGRGGKLRKHVGMARPMTMDRIDEGDRKLYEGVWAANRGILASEEELNPIPPPPNGQRPKAADEVHGLVVKDIWKRSGLDDSLLEEIWNLVDGAEGVKRSSPGRLDRVEFVVGMWLIDQALMGRKLPRKLPESVWESMRVGPALTFRR